MKTCLITGVGGFVGRYLSHYLLERGYRVYGLDRSGSSVSGVHVEKIDILDSSALSSYVKRVSPDYVYHLASQSSVKKSWDMPEYTFDVNVTGTENLLHALQEVQFSRLLVVSSSEVYGVYSQPIREDFSLSPLSPYGKSRLDQEKLLLSYRSKLPSLIVSRSFSHTGPAQSDQFVCSSFAKQISLITSLKTSPIISVGNLSIVRDFLDVRDVVSAYHSLMMSYDDGTYNVCSGKGYSLQHVLTTLLSFSSVPITIHKDSSLLRPVDIPSLIGDNSQILQKGDWRPSYSFDITLRDMFTYWCHHLPP